MGLEGLSRFVMNPTNLDIARSRFNRSSQHKTTFNAGKLIPIYLDEVLPGDTFTMDTSVVCRMMTPIAPVMDNAYLDIYYFFVPMRLVWDNTKNFFGENTDSYWIPQTEKTIPTVSAISTIASYRAGELADYFGIPTSVNISNVQFNALPFRAYGLIWNEWFRDQNTQSPVYVSKGDDNITWYEEDRSHDGSLSYYRYGLSILPVNKFHDYFTSCLPGPQKGPSVLLPLGESASLITTSDIMENPGDYSPASLGTSQLGSSGPVYFFSDPKSTGNSTSLADYPNGTEVKGLVANLRNATASTVNELRQAFAIQRLYEKDARGGTRYTEIIRSHFGVISPDSRLQRPECLGGKRIPINMNQVVQTSSTDNVSPQGNTAAFSNTSDRSSSFTKSFTEHGYLIGLACVRTEHTYQQGIERLWSRKRRFDFYWTALANIGEQAVLNKELYVQAGGSQSKNDEVFGYQEAWAEYRYKPSRTSGFMRSTLNDSLDIWHYGDNFSSLPVLNDSFMKETAVNIDRTLAVPSTSGTHQFLADFFFDCKVARAMPMYSIPGLIDHN